MKKKVLEIGYTDATYGAGYNDVADYSIGDDVSFKLIGSMPSTYDDYSTYSYQFYDTISDGLTFNNDVAVYITPIHGIISQESPNITEYFTIAYPDRVGDDLGNKMTVTCTNTKVIEEVFADSYITVLYTAKLNSDAAIGRDGNENEVYLNYSNNPNGGGEGQTPTDTVIVFTYELDVLKIDGDGGEAVITLKDAEFILKRVTADGIIEYAVVAPDGRLTEWTMTEANATTLKSATDGTFKIIGIEDGTYFLKETKAPANYNLLDDEVEIDIVATTVNGHTYNGSPDTALTALTISINNGTEAPGNTNSGVVNATITNKKGSTLPETGGIGTTLFYIIGSILVVGTGIVLPPKLVPEAKLVFM